MSKSEKQRYWLTYLIPDVDIGDTFKPGLLHLTIVTWFVTDKSEADVCQLFYDKFSSEQPINLEIGERKLFGGGHRVSVNLVKPNSKLEALHQRALDWMVQLEGRWAVKDPHVDDDFVPHIRRRTGTKLRAGEKLIINSLSLVKAKRQEDNIREVAARVELK